MVVLFLAAIMMIATGVVTYWQTTNATYRIPSDSIYLTLGPRENGKEQIRIEDDFRFIVYLDQNRINILGSVFFADKLDLHYFDFYIPFVVTRVQNSVYTEGTPNYYVDPVRGTSSLITVTLTGVEKAHHINFDIYVKELTAIEKMGEKTVILTFGYPNSEQFQSLSKYVGERMVEIPMLIPLKVTVGADKDSFFSSDTFPDPDVEYLVEDHRFATWLISYSGPLSNFYRSIHCTVDNPKMLQQRDSHRFASSLLISIGAAVLIAVAVNSLMLLLKPRNP